MKRSGFEPEYLAEQACKETATRQMLSFILDPAAEADLQPETGSSAAKSLQVSLPKGGIGNDPLLSLRALPVDAIGGPSIFNWKNTDIYDIDGLLLFRDQTIDLDGDNEWRVRTAASNLLRNPVKSIHIGPALDLKALKVKALQEIQKYANLIPLFVNDEEDVRLVCYSYPNLGILCHLTNSSEQFVIDINRLEVIPVNSPQLSDNPESLTSTWSPYDIVVRSTIAHLNQLWKRNIELLPSLPGNVEDLHRAVRDAKASILEVHETDPPLSLIPQEDNHNCAAAAARMIFQFHDIDKEEREIADSMHTGNNGATPEDQVNGINTLLGRSFRAELDPTATLSEAQTEIRANRPFKTGGSGHARAVGGFRTDIGDQNWLHIYDPEPSHQGRICVEAWDEQYNKNFIYIRSL